MSPSPERRRGDDGFTLIEVVVALGITVTVMMALLPQLVGGLRATGTANVVTLAKGVTQSELEKMRNLPFHVSPSAGLFVDVLDRHYPNLKPPTGPTACADPASVTAASWTGFVAPTAARCSFEPSGAFYRTVRHVASARGPLVMVVATQFLTGATPPTPVTPVAGYDSAVTGKHQPAALQVGVTATIAFREREKVETVSTFTQIMGQPAAPTRVLAAASATALEVGSVLADQTKLSMTAGLANATGSASSLSTAQGNATALTTTLSNGERGGGAEHSLTAPPASSVGEKTAPAGELLPSCGWVCWADNRVGATSVSAIDGLPNAGSSAQPLRAAVDNASVNDGVRVSTAPSTDGYRPSLYLRHALVRIDSAEAPHPSQLVGCATDGAGVITASAFVATVEPPSTSAVESCAAARTRTVSLLPTYSSLLNGAAPRGIIRVRLDHAWARCTASPTTGAATHDYRAVVEVWDGASYDVVATIVSGQTTDPLAGVSMDKLVGLGGRTLGDYVASWSSATNATVRSQNAAGNVSMSVPGVVTIVTQPVRRDASGALDQASAVSLTLGAVSCSSQDER